MDIQKIKRIKKYHTIASFIIFCSMIIYGVIKTNLSITANPLSKFGLYEETNPFWIFSLIFTSIVIFINSDNIIKDLDIKYKKVISWLFNISIIGLIGIAFINMDYNRLLHNISAGIFFLFYTISIFCVGILTIKNDFRIAMASIIISILMLISILFLMIKMQSISEIIFMILSFLWNFIIIYSISFKKLLKLFGF